MLLANLSKVRKDYGGNLVFRDIDLEVLERERIGLVGENGSGKTTLFKLLAGLEQPTAGTISRKRNLTIGYLYQEIEASQLELSVYDVVAASSPELQTLAERMKRLEVRMSDPALADDPDVMERVLTEYSTVQERYEALGGYSIGHRVEGVLCGLGFGLHEHRLPVKSFSGGEKKLINLARILLQMPDLLLLDEPDNHLDLRAKAWLEQYIRDYPGTVIIISHDRHLLDHSVTKIYEMEDGEISVFVGNYSAYVAEREQRLQRLQEQYTLQQTEIRRLKHSMHRLKEWAKMNPKFAGRAEYMAKRVEKLKQEAVDKPILERDRIKVALDTERSGKRVLEVKQLSKEIGERVLFEPFDFTVLYGERIGIVGANGAGKTTLLRTMMDLLPATTGTVKIGPSVVTGYYSQEQETLPFESTPLDFVRRLKKFTEGQAIAFLSRFLLSIEEVRTPIAHLSGGQKSRLQIARLMLQEANFLLLDEPTNNLDIASTEVLEEALLDFEGTMLMVSHDRYFLDNIATKILEIGSDAKVRVYPGNYAYYVEKSAG
ncbi:ribosomal protection-like ABC-F family protein [Ktedonospora formicarum]|uniref:ABC transporter ATP-binding protein n=1 Tax=Ktedonospora formicarum TaxID=2778364 RepID=A0A8J3MU27_9CHLR|nr:ABC-F family ATP-binding cassette domain-containing protein [Ktedonospora formicarum]GHO44990.1 ABC transporter ATP-binding protein [Ktedonospora formicarum]